MNKKEFNKINDQINKTQIDTLEYMLPLKHICINRIIPYLKSKHKSIQEYNSKTVYEKYIEILSKLKLIKWKDNFTIQMTKKGEEFLNYIKLIQN